MTPARRWTIERSRRYTHASKRSVGCTVDDASGEPVAACKRDFPRRRGDDGSLGRDSKCVRRAVGDNLLFTGAENHAGRYFLAM